MKLFFSFRVGFTKKIITSFKQEKGYYFLKYLTYFNFLSMLLIHQFELVAL